jgi:flagellar biosynthesis protein FlhG
MTDYLNSKKSRLVDSDGPMKIISILSGKGGVGKSIITYNLGVALSLENYRTLMIDADFLFGNLHLLANTTAELSLSNKYDNILRLDQAVIGLAPDLDLVVSLTDQNNNHDLDNTGLVDFIRRLRTIAANYDYILIDTPTGDIGIISSCASFSDHNLIVVNPELTAISDGYGLFKYLTKANKSSNHSLFVNRSNSGTDSEYIYEKFVLLADRFLGQAISSAGYLLEDEAVAESVRRQKSLFAIDGATGATEQIMKLSKYITDNKRRRLSDFVEDNPETINSEPELADIKE